MKKLNSLSVLVGVVVCLYFAGFSGVAFACEACRKGIKEPVTVVEVGEPSTKGEDSAPKFVHIRTAFQYQKAILVALLHLIKQGER